jgi:hypothetical protein
MQEPRRHVIISGTGRAGTTFLVHLLTQLGLDTGFDAGDIELDRHALAGLERPYLDSKSPYIVKSPLFSRFLPKLLENGQVAIEHAIVPVRQFTAAAASRARVEELAVKAGAKQPVVGGLVLTKNPAEQVGILQAEFASLFELLARYDVPVTLMWFPRLVLEADYTFDKLSFLLNGIARERFRAAFDRIARPDWVHDFPVDLPPAADGSAV